eukprot:jgi/Botrbrau1/21575/Bobra.174_2s0070.2
MERSTTWRGAGVHVPTSLPQAKTILSRAKFPHSCIRNAALPGHSLAGNRGRDSLLFCSPGLQLPRNPTISSVRRRIKVRSSFSVSLWQTAEASAQVALPKGLKALLNPVVLGLIAIVVVALAWIKSILDTPSRKYTPEDPNVGAEYDAWTQEGVLEHYWGEHIHLGYYSDEERKQGYKKKDFKQAKRDFVYEMLKFGDVKGPKRILDVGCGFGGTSRMLAREFPEAEVQGITLSPQQVFRASQMAAESETTNVFFRSMDALAMEFKDKVFDLVWACESGEHMPDKKKYIESMTRVLKPGVLACAAALASCPSNAGCRTHHETHTYSMCFEGP